MENDELETDLPTHRYNWLTTYHWLVQLTYHHARDEQPHQTWTFVWTITIYSLACHPGVGHLRMNRESRRRRTLGQSLVSTRTPTSQVVQISKQNSDSGDRGRTFTSHREVSGLHFSRLCRQGTSRSSGGSERLSPKPRRGPLEFPPPGVPKRERESILVEKCWIKTWAAKKQQHKDKTQKFELNKDTEHKHSSNKTTNATSEMQIWIKANRNPKITWISNERAFST